MGILTRKQGDVFVITSDRPTGVPSRTRAPTRVGEIYEVWTGAKWSTARTEAKEFISLDEADEYIRANYAKVMS